jgi:AcrR family transcriptional regulator
MTRNQKNARELKAAETKNKIYKSAEELFSKYSFNEVSVNKIVERAGVAKGTFYVHFESKHALIADLINDYVSRIDMDYRAYLESIPPTQSTDVVLLSFIRKIAEVLTDKIGCDNMKAVYKAQIDKDISIEALMGYNRSIYKMFENILEMGIHSNEFKSALPPDILARHFMMAFRGITYEWCVRYPEFDFVAQVIQHFKLIVSGLKCK